MNLLGRYRLRSLNGADAGKSFRIGKKKELVIGRSSQSGTHLTDPFMSRFHCRIFFNEGTFNLEDLGSTSGTRVNGRRIHYVALNDGDEIRMGTTDLIFERRCAIPFVQPSKRQQQRDCPGGESGWFEPTVHIGNELSSSVSM